MEKYQKKMVESDVLIDVLCDICGASCKKSEPEGYEYSNWYVSWGYGSKKDGTRWDVDFCEECSDKLKEHIKSLGGRIREENRWG